MAEDEVIKRLLAAEAQAEEIIARAEQQRAQLIEQARLAAQAARARQAEHGAEVLASFTAQAEQRSAQAIAELRRRYSERAAALKAAAAVAQERALEAAVGVLIGAEGPPQ